jgi:peptidoglycan/LPS O-acetylase OafA/YrhL
MYGNVKGGWLGVDVFFVLSGYLITRVLLDDVSKTGHVSFVRFYLRRARRLLPALFLGLALAWTVWPSTLSKPPFSEVVPSVVFYFANWRAAYNVELMGALTHTWSLSIEEQFYFLWPIAIAILVRMRTRVWLVCAVILVLTLTGAWLHARRSLAGSMFATNIRASELLIGALVGWAHRDHGGRVQTLAGLMLWPAVAFFVYSFLFVDLTQQWLFYGGFPFIAIAAAVIVVAAPKLRLLSWSPLVWLGKRSYGIYIYHFPIILALEGLRTSHDISNLLWVTALRIMLTVAVAAVSFRFVEDPIRTMQWGHRAPKGAHLPEQFEEAHAQKPTWPS